MNMMSLKFQKNSLLNLLKTNKEDIMRKKLLGLTKILFLGVFLILGTSGTSMAYLQGWELNLSGLSIGDLGDYTNIDRIDVNGQSTVNQSFGADGVFNNGDQFTELATMNQVVYFTEPGNASDIHTFPNSGGNNGYYMYVYASGLQGTVYDVSTPNLADPTTWTFRYSFTPGVGNIGMYIDNDTDPTNGVLETLTDFDLAFGGGIGNPGFLGGAENNGTTNITAFFRNTQTGVFFDNSGTDFTSLPVDFALGLLNTNNQVIASTFQIYGGATPTGLGGFTTDINNAGQFNVNVVPEPASLTLMGIGLLGIGGLVRKRFLGLRK